MNPLALPADRMLNLGWHWLTRTADRKDVDRLAQLLEQADRADGSTPPGGRRRWSRDAEMAAFKASLG